MEEESRAQRAEFLDLLNTCTKEVVPAIRVTTPPDFPPKAKEAIRFLLEKHMESSGVSMDIFFVA